MSYIDVADLTPSQVSGYAGSDLTFDFISQLSTSQVSALRTDQIRAIATEAISALTFDHLNALASHAVRALMPAQISAFSADQLYQQNTADNSAPRFFGDVPFVAPSGAIAFLRALSTSQTAALDVNELYSLLEKGVNGSILDSFSSAQIQALTTDQIGSIPRETVDSPDGPLAISPRQISQLSTAQIQGLQFDQLGWLTTSQLAGFSSAQVKALTGDQLYDVNNDDDGDWFQPPHYSCFRPRRYPRSVLMRSARGGATCAPSVSPSYAHCRRGN
jgi:hypothetical protein